MNAVRPVKHFINHSWYNVPAPLRQANGDEGAQHGNQAAAGQIQAYWQDDEEDELHMEDSM